MPNLDILKVVLLVVVVVAVVALVGILIAQVGVPLVQLGNAAAEAAVEGQDNGVNPIPLSSIAELWSVFGVGLLFDDSWSVVGPLIGVGIVTVVLAVFGFKLVRMLL